MSRPVGSASSNALEVNFNEVDSGTVVPPARKEPAQTQVEPWLGHQPLTFNEPEFRGAMSSGQDLAAQSARETAERQGSIKTLASLEGPLAQLAQKYPDPISFFGNTEFKVKDVALGSFGDALRTDNFTKAASALSAKDVRTSVEEQVKKAWPKSTPQEAEKLKQYFMGQVAESLRERVAPKLQDVATRMLSEAASSFKKTAADPVEVKQLAARLNDMAGPLASPADQASVRDLRAALGLELDVATVTPEKLTQALNERAAVMQNEAKKMKYHDRPTLFRALAEQEVGPIFKQAAGVREGSLLAAQIDVVKEQGQSEATNLGYVKIASAVAAGALTGGLALGGVGVSGIAVGVGVSTSMATPAVMLAWEEVGTAKASESAGTMKAGAGEDAQRKAEIETVVAGVSIAGATGANQLLHGVAHTPLGKVLVHGAVELAAEVAGHTGAHALAGAFAAKGDASGLNALDRAKP